MVIYLKKGDVNMDEKLDELIALAKKQNKLMARAADWLTFFGGADNPLHDIAGYKLFLEFSDY